MTMTYLTEVTGPSSMLEASEASVRLFEAESGSVEAMTGSSKVVTGSREVESREAPDASREVVSSWFTITNYHYVNSKSIPEKVKLVRNPVETIVAQK